MANLVVNYFYVFGMDIGEVQSFKISAENSETGEIFSLKELFPPPENADNDWYYKNWGIGCDVYHTILRCKGNNFLRYELESRWNPPLNGIRNIALKHPNLIFVISYYELTDYWRGGAVFKGDKWADWRYSDCDFGDFLNICYNYGDRDLLESSFGIFLQKLFNLMKEKEKKACERMIKKI
jgi:hypothetical protein